ncbi:hypothetical protein [Caulobacter vibrioides]|uniref:hypothetical protein n=1 Tax=Caulobacter vibrioides TaxID=155892 RepID=UPI000BB4D346|nr:hypothetical protein [Caulobacter vibrioides]ATC26512.1 hypothetical protein CA608_19245 [Caulobacter vibrioides]PLR12334.1 hypothetical protein CVUC_08875 [Caulobacter vibrioides]
MSALAILDLSLLWAAAYAFHWRGHLLGRRAEGWPQAPRSVRRALDLAAGGCFLAGLAVLIFRPAPNLAHLAVDTTIAAYAIVMAINVARQRASRG